MYYIFNLSNKLWKSKYKTTILRNSYVEKKLIFVKCKTAIFRIMAVLNLIIFMIFHYIPIIHFVNEIFKDNNKSVLKLGSLT